MDDQRLVVLQSMGTGRLSGTATPQLLAYIDQLGGTPELLLDAISGAHRHPLVAAAPNLPLRNPDGREPSPAWASSPPVAHDPTGQIAGVVERSPDGLYAPLAGDPASGANLDLFEILYQPPTPRT